MARAARGSARSFPNLTKVVDDIAFINSMHTDSALHSVGQILMHTGYPRQGHPSLGSWVTYGLGTENRNMPGFVVMADGRPTGGRALHDAGFLPGIHQATLADLEPGNPPVPHIKAPAFLSRGPAARAVGSGAEVESPSIAAGIVRSPSSTRASLHSRRRFACRWKRRSSSISVTSRTR